MLFEGRHAVVADFGIARVVAAAGSQRLTATGIAVGTPAYMSPEQAAGSRDLDGRSDLYSLGCVVNEMLAGQPPFTGPTVESLVHQHLNVTPRPVTEVRPSVTPVVRDALVKALAKTPADRFTSTAEFAAALAAGPRPAPASKRRGALWIPAGAAGLLLALVAVAAWQEWGPFGGGRSRPANRDWILQVLAQGLRSGTMPFKSRPDMLSQAHSGTR